MKLHFFFLGLLVFAQLHAQEKTLLDWDIDSVFDEPVTESPPEELKTDAAANGTAADKLKQQSFILDASYEFMAGIMPSWREAEDHGFFLDRAIKLRSSLGMDAQIDKTFRVRTTVYFEIPSFGFKLGDFFFDYNLYDVVFFRGGKYAQSWGISPNYNFTDLLARIPPRIKNPGESFILKADVPTGIGGFQALTMTRVDLMSSNPALPKLEDFGFGGKYNLALRAADFDFGIFYQEGMALRAFLSVKTTLWNTELYGEGLFAIDVHKPSNVSGAVSLGFVRDFFAGKFNVNGEMFYNAEKGAYWYRPESNIREAGRTPFIEGVNLAMNLLYKFGGKGDFRLFTQIKYAPFENSTQLIPGFTLNPWSHIGLYFAVPMALGSKEGYYRKNTLTVDKDGKNVPFRIMILVSVSGSIKFSLTK